MSDKINKWIAVLCFIIFLFALIGSQSKDLSKQREELYDLRFKVQYMESVIVSDRMAILEYMYLLYEETDDEILLKLIRKFEREDHILQQVE